MLSNSSFLERLLNICSEETADSLVSYMYIKTAGQ